ncbi:enediyne polyketide synthase [Scopulibacillus darangshiensis]|uniref:Enediyne polyketide synthase n=1 Tax=Scopulibacillus darangshiensis TaxID=442528 RepID=A0A4R2NRN4_9BACL|nr:type I polyketide synthase [Scopulibacillus darangshiensis]TCP24477.1 enediyne polyketide synthase [Scopulibacillus darangshiensis]
MSKIAVVGMSCLYPDASSPTELWNNVLTKRRSFRKIPEKRLSLKDYYSSNPKTPDKIYSKMASVIKNYSFDRVRYKISGSNFRSTDMTHWVALDIATKALEDAGYMSNKNLPNEKTGVIVGNTLTGEFSRSSLMRLRWPYVKRILAKQLKKESWTSERISKFLLEAEYAYKEPFEPVNAETLAGGLSNTIAGRICNYYDLKGGGYTVDGACSSSLIAVKDGCIALTQHDLDVALVGGVDLSLDPFELIGFSKTEALAKSEMRIYDQKSNGFWPGEGCGFVVLMRLQDAIDQGFNIYAKINGWGVSSDGSGGITRPTIDGQQLAINKAYNKAGYGIDTVSYFEGHGTGTKVGDEVELNTIIKAHGDVTRGNPGVIGSIKGNFGHTKAAAGIAGLIKSVLTLHHQIIPPITGHTDSHSILLENKNTLTVLNEAKVWNGKGPMRASVSSMGFGGINVHLTMEGTKKEQKVLTSQEKWVTSSSQDTELIIIDAENRMVLGGLLQTIHEQSKEMSYGELTDLSVNLYQNLSDKPLKVALVVKSPAELQNKTDKLINFLKSQSSFIINTDEGIYFTDNIKEAKVGLLFPGQGVRVGSENQWLKNKFKGIQQFHNKFPISNKGDIVNTSNAQPNIIKSTLAGLHFLKSLSVDSDIAVGHSLGELTALHWAGSIDENDVIRLAEIRGRVMGNVSGPNGAMATIFESKENVTNILTPGAVISCINGSKQTVIAGEKVSIDQSIKAAENKGYFAKKLQVSHAFHSPLMNDSKSTLSNYLKNYHFTEPKRNIISTTTGDMVNDVANIKEILISQLTKPVLFLGALNQLKSFSLDLLVEVGPGKSLNHIAKSEMDVPVVSMETEHHSVDGLLNVTGALFVLGKTSCGQLKALYNRYTRPFDSEGDSQYFVNPCEMVDEDDGIESTYDRLISEEVAATAEEEITDISTDNSENAFKKLLSEKVELPIESISDDSRLLDDLHLSSISVGQIIGQAAKSLNIKVPISFLEFTNSTVKEVSNFLSQQIGNYDDAAEMSPEGIKDWAGVFTIEQVEKSLVRRSSDFQGNDWDLFIPNNFPLKKQLEKTLSDYKGQGVITGYSDSPNNFNLLLKAATVAKEKRSKLVLIQTESLKASSFAKTFHLETNIDTLVITIPESNQAIPWIIEEVKHLKGFNEVRYTASGKRLEPRVKSLPLKGDGIARILDNKDIILFTGGGKGIATECALFLAKETGSRLVLIGRSDPNSDTQLFNNLERLKKHKIDFNYVQADITNEIHVKKAMKWIRSNVGHVTGIVHATGVNHPKSLNNLTNSDLNETVQPKVNGLRNLIENIESEYLRFFVSFGSIIGRSGLHGEAHYGLANEWLTNETSKINKQLIHCKTLTMEWSVWSGVGMGQSLGTVDLLKKQGIVPIKIEQGTRCFNTLLANLLIGNLTSPSAIITGRFGKMPTLKLGEKPLPFYRFMEKPVIHYPKYELVADATLKEDTDLYLKDHVFDNNLLFPAVMGLEMMAQAIISLSEKKEGLMFKNVRFDQPIIVDPNQKSNVRVVAQRKEDNDYELAIRSNHTDYAINHFQATCDTNSNFNKKNYKHLITNSSYQTTLNPDQDLYGQVLFQSGMFQKVQNYKRLIATETLFIVKPKTEQWFSTFYPEKLVLQDPGVRDAALHGIQSCVPNQILIPVSVGKINFIGDIGKANYVYAKEVSQSESNYEYNILILDKEGNLLESWDHLTLTAVKSLPSVNLNEKLSCIVFNRKIKQLNLDKAPVISVDSFEGSREWKKAQSLYQLTGITNPVLKRQDGKPELLDTNVSASFSYKYGMTFSALGKGAIGCDIEVVDESCNWVTLLDTEQLGLSTQIMNVMSESFDHSATRVWCAMECAKKAGYNDTKNFRISIKNTNLLILRNKKVSVFSYKFKKEDNHYILSLLMEGS